MDIHHSFYMETAMRSLFSLLLALPLAAQTRFVRFEKQVLATGLRGGYQVAATDLNRDGKPDLIALASGMTELIWLENPTWERRVIAPKLSRMINTWPLDTDKDGVPELLVAHAFENEAARSVG
ncbi:MAG: VCBS repeat-containing protein, partial [Acidobacteria bacterium]|nr:VCBS repeat-containing protein [Acidobacteriota bacterium]